MKVRAFLAEDEMRLCPSADSSSHKDFETEDINTDDAEQLCRLFFSGDVQVLGSFSSKDRLTKHIEKENIQAKTINWNEPGVYCIWLPAHHREVNSAKNLLTRELKFFFMLDQHIERNEKGKIDCLARTIGR